MVSSKKLGSSLSTSSKKKKHGGVGGSTLTAPGKVISCPKEDSGTRFMDYDLLKSQDMKEDKKKFLTGSTPIDYMWWIQVKINTLNTKAPRGGGGGDEDEEENPKPTEWPIFAHWCIDPESTSKHAGKFIELTLNELSLIRWPYAEKISEFVRKRCEDISDLTSNGEPIWTFGHSFEMSMVCDANMESERRPLVDPRHIEKKAKANFSKRKGAQKSKPTPTDPPPPRGEVNGTKGKGKGKDKVSEPKVTKTTPRKNVTATGEDDHPKKKKKAQKVDDFAMPNSKRITPNVFAQGTDVTLGDLMLAHAERIGYPSLRIMRPLLKVYFGDDTSPGSSPNTKSASSSRKNKENDTPDRIMIRGKTMLNRSSISNDETTPRRAIFKTKKKKITRIPSTPAITEDMLVGETSPAPVHKNKPTPSISSSRRGRKKEVDLPPPIPKETPKPTPKPKKPTPKPKPKKLLTPSPPSSPDILEEEEELVVQGPSKKRKQSTSNYVLMLMDTSTGKSIYEKELERFDVIAINEATK